MDERENSHLLGPSLGNNTPDALIPDISTDVRLWPSHFVPISPPSEASTTSVASSPVSDTSRHPPGKLTKSPKQKKFPCACCDALFERPSSLRQHMLTHTGEKPHPCQKCSRRFSVISNLRRHVKSCQEGDDKRKLITGMPTSPSSSERTHQVQHSHPSIPHTISPENQSSPSTQHQYWLPGSLASFQNAATLTSDYTRAKENNLILPGVHVTIPLPPVPSSSYTQSSLPPLSSHANTSQVDLTDVRPVVGLDGLTRYERIEERDSYDPTTPEHPYHPASWTGRLPGPGLMQVDQLVRRVVPGHRR
ncbi:hypothetical protein BS47DRAFT_1488917 [Hydnum rufescens UP504]|uniref:C2H2-type domain-containing protein n=1 Tax=Hydnum rufescens UP504 TaxID=1448309 RepID=A0A9P6AKM7_9AGAM|nr:hypothetical protein BS47DRAFT_1488917 [Hydnum rufescens UP504]